MIARNGPANAEALGPSDASVALVSFRRNTGLTANGSKSGPVLRACPAKQVKSYISRGYSKIELSGGFLGVRSRVSQSVSANAAPVVAP